MTKHTHESNWGYKVKEGCPRCLELTGGAVAIKGWGSRGRYSGHQTDEQIRKAIRAHDCKASKCGPVCTTFDW